MVPSASVLADARRAERERGYRGGRRSGRIARIVLADVGKTDALFRIRGGEEAAVNIDAERTVRIVVAEGKGKALHLRSRQSGGRIVPVDGDGKAVAVVFRERERVRRFAFLAHGELRSLQSDGERFKIRIHKTQGKCEVLLCFIERIFPCRRKPLEREIAAESYAIAVFIQQIGEVSPIFRGIFRIRRIEYRRIIDRAHAQKDCAHRRQQQCEYGGQ